MIYPNMFYLKDLLRKVFFMLNISKIGLYKDRNNYIMGMFNRFEFKVENPNERIVLEISRYDYEIIKRSLEESYNSELHKTSWEPENPNEYPLRYWYRGNKITKRINSVLRFIKKQVERL